MLEEITRKQQERILSIETIFNVNHFFLYNLSLVHFHFDAYRYTSPKC
jgi:hypothetical protein